MFVFICTKGFTIKNDNNFILLAFFISRNFIFTPIVRLIYIECIIIFFSFIIRSTPVRAKKFHIIPVLRGDTIEAIYNQQYTLANWKFYFRTKKSSVEAYAIQVLRRVYVIPSSTNIFKRRWTRNFCTAVIN